MIPLLNITLVQASLEWEARDKNLQQFDTFFQELPRDTHLVVLPEMFSTGFTMKPRAVAERSDGFAVEWMKTKARKYRTAITGSLVIEDNGKYYNRLFFVTETGEIRHYDKRHTFTLAGEHKVYTAGTEKLIVDLHGWKICPLICYDLRFPVWARNTENYLVLIYVANWPKLRVAAWDALLKARAIENMCYTLGVNRVGTDANGYEYSGHSSVYSELGDLLAYSEKEEMLHLSLKAETVIRSRDKLQFLNDADAFSLKV